MRSDIETLISSVFRIAKYVAQISNIPIEERTATAMQYHTLVFLEKNPNSTLSEFANYMKASLSSATQIIERMHKSGFVIRNQDEKDRRVIRLSLTVDGKEKLAQLKEAKKQRMKDLVKNLSKEDISDLVRIQNKMIETIQDK